MNESRKSPALLALLFALLLGACRGDSGPVPLQGASIGGPFTLTAHDGRRVTERDFEGKYRIVYFGFTFCPDVCPTDLQVIGGALRRFEERAPDRAARVQPLFITADPARDTPEILARYVAAFHPRILGLTGSEAEIAAVATAYGAMIQRGQPDAEGNYLVNHSRIVYLMGPEGQPIALLPTQEGIDAVAAELDQWVR